MIGSCSNALISSSIASLQRVTDRTPENRISILKSGIQIAKRRSAQTTVNLSYYSFERQRHTFSKSEGAAAMKSNVIKTSSSLSSARP